MVSTFLLLAWLFASGGLECIAHFFSAGFGKVRGVGKLARDDDEDAADCGFSAMGERGSKLEDEAGVKGCEFDAFEFTESERVESKEAGSGVACVGGDASP